jgi:hypothetical protein
MVRGETLSVGARCGWVGLFEAWTTVVGKAASERRGGAMLRGERKARGGWKRWRGSAEGRG